ncbi:response regulator [Novosphingobium sp. ZW T3_23]|uniref:response regulator n=1 Tax=Novosphingobium sp. ZW T3_23 TaxID=3378084 RepID=UPI003853E9B8
MTPNDQSTVSSFEDQKYLTRKSILIIEDDYFIAFDLRGVLMDRGADVIGPISDPDAALKLIESNASFDAAVVDINLHGEMSFPLVDELIKRDVPVMFLTGYSADVVPYRLRHLPRHQKPLSLKSIAEVVRNLIEGHR